MRKIALICCLVFFPSFVWAGIEVKSPSYTIEIVDQVKDLSKENHPSFYLAPSELGEFKKEQILDLSNDNKVLKVSLDKNVFDFADDTTSKANTTLLSNQNLRISINDATLGATEGVGAMPTLCNKKNRCSSTNATQWERHEFGWGFTTEINPNKYTRYFSLNNQQKYSTMQKQNTPFQLTFVLKKDTKNNQEATLNILDLNLEQIP